MRNTSFQVFCLALALLSTDVAAKANRKYAPVKPLHPLSGWNVTDIALSFRWERQCKYSERKSQRWTTYEYQLQVADNRMFKDPSIDCVQIAPVNVEDPDDEDETFKYWREVMYMPPETLSPGRWYWRVRVADDDGGPWSKPVSFTINNDHSKKSPGRKLSATNPIFIFELYGQYGEMVDKWNRYYSFFPNDLKPFTAFAVYREEIGVSVEMDGLEGTFIEMLEPFNRLKIPFFLKTGGPDADFQIIADLAEIEYIFKNNKSVLGVTTAENFWDYILSEDNPEAKTKQLLWEKRLMMLCAKYGKYMIYGEGNYTFPTWDRFLGQEPDGVNYEWMSPEFLREHKNYFIPCMKNNVNIAHHQADSAILGSWLSGTTTHFGTWVEAWYWLSCGFGELFAKQGKGNLDNGDFSNMPFNMWVQMQIPGVAKGATVYNFQGESSTTEWGEYNSKTDRFEEEDEIVAEKYTAFFDMHGHKTPALDRYIIPFMRAVIKQKLIPTKAEVLKEIKIAVDPGPVREDDGYKGNMLSYGQYAQLYLNTYGIREYSDAGDMSDDEFFEVAPTGCRYEIIPNSGRYYFVPVLPHPARDIGGTAIREVKLSSLQDKASVVAAFDKAYPERSTGDAWVTLVGNKIFIMNSHENKNVVEEYNIPLTRDGGISNMSGSIGPHAYVIGKRKDNAIWLQANVDMKSDKYTDGRTTEMAFRCKRKPQVKVSPANALKKSKWDQNSKTLHVVLSHSSGAVDVTLMVGR